MKESEKNKYEKKINELEGKIKKLKEEKHIGQADADTHFKKDGAEGVYESLDRLLNLGGLIKSTEKLPEIHGKIKAIDAQLKTKLKSIPLKTTRFGSKQTKRWTDIPNPREREVDIFDEDSFLLVVVEIPGIEEKSINVVLEKDKLTISADRDGKKIQKEILLPCVPKGKITKNYKNGILEIKIIKNGTSPKEFTG